MAIFCPTASFLFDYLPFAEKYLNDLYDRVQRETNLSTEAVALREAIDKLEASQDDINHLQIGYQKVADEDKISDNLKEYIKNTKNILAVCHVLFIFFQILQTSNGIPP